MKKKILMLILCGVLLGTNLVYAEEIDFLSLSESLNEGETYINGEIRTDLSKLQDVGNGWLVNKTDENGEVQRCFTVDFENFRPVSVYDDKANLDSHSRAGEMDEIKWADGVYLARSTPYDNRDRSGRILEKNGYLYILDTDFQLIKRITFEWYVREMSYIEGVYYVRIWNESFLKENVWTHRPEDKVNQVYSSRDLENWELEPELEHVPMTTGENVLTMKDYTIYTFENGKIGNQIVYEGTNVTKNSSPYSNTEAQNVLNIVGEYYHIVNNEDDTNLGWLSRDGVYFTKFNFGTPVVKNGVGVLSGTYNDRRNIYVRKDVIDQYLQQGEVYVKLEDKILGFATPPITEADRTLVPMRFLFEQLGAEVEWDETTNTATATLSSNTEEQIQTFGLGDTKTVTFSIDNTTATVNGAEATMDVPARLVNDKTMVPLRFLSENLGYTVTWDEETNTASIY